MSELAILGGGPAGLGVAFYAARAGVPFELFERERELGGMCRTLRSGSHRFDAGAHRFHDLDPEITQDVRALLGDELRPVKAPSVVWLDGRFVDFPPTPLNAALACGLGGAARIAAELLRADRRGGPANFREFALSRFGETLARKLLLNYAEKLWGLPAERLSAEVATKRLHGMTLRSLLLELLRPRRKAAHIDGEFLYPRLGYGRIGERLAAALPDRSVWTNHEVAGFDVSGGRVERLRFRHGRVVETPGRVVSTLPLTQLVRLLGDAASDDARAAAEGLLFRRVRLVFLRLDQPRVSANASIYLPDPRLCVSRVSEPKNRSEELAPPGETSLVAEVPCFAGDALARLPDGELEDRVTRELAEIGLLNPERVLERKHATLPYGYPVHSVDYRDRVRRIQAALAAIRNLDTLGRAGAFFYSHLHDQLRFGKDYVARLARRPGVVQTA